MEQPFLTGEKIYLRPIGETDLTTRYRDWFNDEEVSRFNSHHRFPQYDENMSDYYERVIKSQRNLVLAICDLQSHLHIGNIALEDIDSVDQRAELSIVIGEKAYRGKGIGTEAISLIVGHGFNALNLHRVACGTNEDNIAMQKAALANGFREEGRLRQALFKQGAFKDVIRYGLLRDEATH